MCYGSEDLFHNQGLLGETKKMYRSGKLGHLESTYRSRALDRNGKLTIACHNTVYNLRRLVHSTTLADDIKHETVRVPQVPRLALVYSFSAP